MYLASLRREMRHGIVSVYEVRKQFVLCWTFIYCTADCSSPRRSRIYHACSTNCALGNVFELVAVHIELFVENGVVLLPPSGMLALR